MATRFSTPYFDFLIFFILINDFFKTSANNNNNNNNNILFKLVLQFNIYKVLNWKSKTSGTPDVVKTNRVWSPIYNTLKMY